MNPTRRISLIDRLAKAIGYVGPDFERFGGTFLDCLLELPINHQGVNLVGYRKRRCIVPMDAFYEKKEGRLYKFLMKDRQPFGVAGIWENWRNPAGDWERTFCIITVEANDLVRKIHDRMPAIIAAEEHQRWFDGADDLLVPYLADKMTVILA
jgi:hypothetical protein